MQDVTNTDKTLGTIANILGKAEDKNQVELELENMAYYDQLTKIPNRFLFGKYVKQRIAHSNKVKGAFCILFLDIDSFKNINDTSGHHYGDMVLVKAAENISRCIRKTDVICRFGGDEFLILLHYANNKTDVERVAKKIIEVIQEPIIINEKEINITASMGISVFPEDGTDKDTLIKNADIAMYKAKNHGKNRFIFCTEDMKNEISKEMALTSHLYRALEKGELSLVYQPQIQTKNSKLVATEALLRWNNPVLGNISPAVFIPIAEKNGYIISIGEWVLSEACKQNKIWQDQGLPKIRVAVNVSVNQLNQGNFPETVKKILEKVKLDPQYLEIEITESVAMEKSEVIMNSLYKLKELGVSIAIDDFGTEYSSLNRIKDLPVDRIKLDIQFIRNILINEKEREITDAIISLAKKLNLAVIAEGVEEKEQFLYLKNKNCDEVQGYYFYRPLLSTDLENLLRKTDV
jgi:diguanylate cyclase (GGDEF)-like protein